MSSRCRGAVVGWLLLAAGAAAVAVAADQGGDAAQAHVVDIVVHQGKRVSGPAVIKVQQGDEVTLRITSDTADEFHLHGYNLLVHLAPNRTATLHFAAKLAGRFTFELHKADVELGAVEVYPR
ncbi:MAG: cupredoxin domain-containing protein [Steroidobacteraceae bacterium]